MEVIFDRSSSAKMSLTCSWASTFVMKRLVAGFFSTGDEVGAVSEVFSDVPLVVVAGFSVEVAGGILTLAPAGWGVVGLA